MQFARLQSLKAVRIQPAALWRALIQGASLQEGTREGAHRCFKKSCYGNVSCISLLTLKKVLIFRKTGHFITKFDIVFTCTMISRDHLRNWGLIKLREMTVYDQNGFHLHFVRPSIDFTFQLWTARGQLWPRERESNEPGSK